MNEYIDKLNSTDRSIRRSTITSIFESTDLKSHEKEDLLIQGLKDSHDSVRSLSVDFLIEICSQTESKREISKLLFDQCVNEKIWTVRYLILKKIIKLKNIDLSIHRYDLIKLSFDLKPQVRIASAELLMKLSHESQDDSVVQRLIDLWKDKDESVRAKLIILLQESKNPKIKTFMKEYKAKLTEKENKRKEMAGLFDGI